MPGGNLAQGSRSLALRADAPIRCWTCLSSLSLYPDPFGLQPLCVHFLNSAIFRLTNDSDAGRGCGKGFKVNGGDSSSHRRRQGRSQRFHGGGRWAPFKGSLPFYRLCFAHVHFLNPEFNPASRSLQSECASAVSARALVLQIHNLDTLFVEDSSSAFIVGCKEQKLSLDCRAVKRPIFLADHGYIFLADHGYICSESFPRGFGQGTGRRGGELCCSVCGCAPTLIRAV
jgi:hypothetical protein